MFQANPMLPHEAFCLLGTPPITAMSAAGPSGPKVAVLNGKLIRVDAIVDPQVAIVGGGSVKLGELVVLEARLSNQAPQYLKSAKIKWTVTEKGQEKVCWTDGKKVIFGAGVEPTTITANAHLTLNYQIDAEVVPLACAATQTVQVGTPDPGPEPGPSPGPDPGSGVAQQVKTWAVALVDAVTRGKSAQPLAQSFKSVSLGIGEGDLKDLRGVLRATKSRNNDALVASGVDPRKWDGWGTNLQDLLYGKYVAGEMRKTEDIKKLWMDVCNGLFYSK